MMIQFNLLPDIKKEYIKAKRQKQLIISTSILVSTGFIVLTFVLFGVVQGAQRKYINDLSKDINSRIETLESIPDLDKILTVQQQSQTLEGLHQENPYVVRLFSYLSTVTPQTVKYSSITIDTTENVITIEGTSSDFVELNRYVDTLKFATYEARDIEETENEQSENGPDAIIEPTTGTPFTILTTELSRNTEGSVIELSFEYDGILFDNTKAVTIVVPSTISTQSETEAPKLDLFNDEIGN